jgi:hypothetical protein
MSSRIAASPCARALIGVFTSEGAITFTRIFSGAYQAAIDFDIPRIAPFEAAYACVPKCRACGEKPSTLAMFRIVPRRPSASTSCFSMRFSAARHMKNMDFTLASSVTSQPSSEHSCRGPSPNFRPLMPATLKTASRRP